MLRAFLLVLALVVALPPPVESWPHPPPPGMVDLVVDGSLAVGPSPNPGRIQVAATSESLPPFPLLTAGAGPGRVGAMGFANAAGTFAVSGVPIPAAAYLVIPWDEFGLTLYQAVATHGRDIHVGWVYCQGETRLLGTYHESTQYPLSWNPMVGQCRASAPEVETHVAFPPIDMPYPSVVRGFTVQGPAIHFDGTGPGRILVGDEEKVLLPFLVIDCRNCGANAWWELHSLLHDVDDETVTFVIIYLKLSSPGMVETHYGVTLPGMISEPSRWYAAEWTSP